MLIIRDAQMQAFQRERDKEIVVQLVRTLERCHQIALETPRELLQQQLHDALLRARARGIDATGAVLTYFAMMRSIGVRFDETRLSLAILNDTTIPANLRIYIVAGLPIADVQAELVLLPLHAGSID